MFGSTNVKFTVTCFGHMADVWFYEAWVVLVKMLFVVTVLTHNVHGKQGKHISHIESRSNHKKSGN